MTPKRFQSIKKIQNCFHSRQSFVTVFWDEEGVLLVEFLAKSTWNDKIRVTKEWYMDTLMNVQCAI